MVGDTHRVKEFVRLEYVEPALRRGDSKLEVVAGNVHKSLGLNNRVPIVCQALKSRAFLEANHLEIERIEGPPSGQGTRVKLTYRLMDRPSQSVRPSESELEESPLLGLLRLEGIGKEVFQSLGGGEAFIRRERERFYKSDDEE
jgi:hypothetical protein